MKTYQQIADEIAKLVAEKQAAYGGTQPIPDISRVEFILAGSCRACSCSCLPQMHCSVTDEMKSARPSGEILSIFTG